MGRYYFLSLALKVVLEVLVRLGYLTKMHISKLVDGDENYFEKVNGSDNDWIDEFLRKMNTDFFAEAYAPVGTKIAWAISYILIALVVVLLSRVAWFERSGEAGHYRTVLNQLMSCMIDQVSSFLQITYP